jgi:hypothetical protein
LPRVEDERRAYRSWAMHCEAHGSPSLAQLTGLIPIDLFSWNALVGCNSAAVERWSALSIDPYRSTLLINHEAPMEVILPQHSTRRALAAGTAPYARSFVTGVFTQRLADFGLVVASAEDAQPPLAMPWRRHRLQRDRIRRTRPRLPLGRQEGQTPAGSLFQSARSGTRQNVSSAPSSSGASASSSAGEASAAICSPSA